MADLSQLSDEDLQKLIGQHEVESGVNDFNYNGNSGNLDKPIDQNSRKYFVDYEDPRAVNPMERLTPWGQKMFELASDNKMIAAAGFTGWYKYIKPWFY